MDPWITSVVIILGRYSLDKGAELAKEAGPKALETAKEMFRMVLERIAHSKPETAAEFPNQPATYQQPLESALAAEVQASPDFAAQLEALLEQYEQAAQEHAAAQGVAPVAIRTRDGAVAYGSGATALGAGAQQIRVGGDVSGGIATGSGRIGRPAEDPPVEPGKRP